MLCVSALASDVRGVVVVGAFAFLLFHFTDVFFFGIVGLGSEGLIVRYAPPAGVEGVGAVGVDVILFFAGGEGCVAWDVAAACVGGG